MVEVMQEDREAAARIIGLSGEYLEAERAILGLLDRNHVVQAFARHRTTALAAKEAENAELRAKVESLPDYIELFRIIRAAGRSDREKARAVFAAISPTLAETQT